MSLTQWLLLPLFIHLALLGVVTMRSLVGRIRSVRSGETRLKTIALDSSKWPDDLRQLGNNFSNQFEIPTLWYALCAMLVGMGMVDAVQAVLSWVFVAARILHTIIHTGSNAVPRRMYAFLASYVALMAMWGWFGLRLFFRG
jgi:hypothetical protein